MLLQLSKIIGDWNKHNSAAISTIKKKGSLFLSFQAKVEDIFAIGFKNELEKIVASLKTFYLLTNAGTFNYRNTHRWIKSWSILSKSTENLGRNYGRPNYRVLYTPNRLISFFVGGPARFIRKCAFGRRSRILNEEYDER